MLDTGVNVSLEYFRSQLSAVASEVARDESVDPRALQQAVHRLDSAVAERTFADSRRTTLGGDIT
jgi:aminopeptidase N